MYESVAKFPCGEVTVAKLPCGEVTGNRLLVLVLCWSRVLEYFLVSVTVISQLSSLCNLIRRWLCVSLLIREVRTDTLQFLCPTAHMCTQGMIVTSLIKIIAKCPRLKIVCCVQSCRNKQEMIMIKLRTIFECFQEKLGWVTFQVKQKRMENMRQLTLHDMMKK